MLSQIARDHKSAVGYRLHKKDLYNLYLISSPVSEYKSAITTYLEVSNAFIVNNKMYILSFYNLQ